MGDTRPSGKGSEVEKLKAFWAAFEALERRISAFTSLPVGSLDRVKLQEQLITISKMLPSGLT